MSFIKNNKISLLLALGLLLSIASIFYLNNEISHLKEQLKYERDRNDRIDMQRMEMMMMNNRYSH